MLLLLRFGLLFHGALPCGWPSTRSKGWCRADERGLNRLWRGPQQITGGHWIPAFMASVLAPAAWRYSPPSALDRALAIVNCPASRAGLPKWAHVPAWNDIDAVSPWGYVSGLLSRNDIRAIAARDCVSGRPTRLCNVALRLSRAYESQHG